MIRCLRLTVTRALNHRTGPDDIRQLLSGGLPAGSAALAPDVLSEARQELVQGHPGPYTILFALLLDDCELDTMWKPCLAQVRQCIEQAAPKLGTLGDSLRQGLKLRTAKLTTESREFPTCYFVLNRGRMPVFAVREASGDFKHVHSNDLLQAMQPVNPIDMSCDCVFLGDAAVISMLRTAAKIMSVELVLTSNHTWEVDEDIVKWDHLYAVFTEQSSVTSFVLVRDAPVMQRVEILCFSEGGLHHSCFADDNYARRSMLVESAAAGSPNMITVLGMKMLGFSGSLSALTAAGTEDVRRPAAEHYARLLTKAKPDCGNSRVLLRQSSSTTKRRKTTHVVEAWDESLLRRTVCLDRRRSCTDFVDFACDSVFDFASRWAACNLQAAAQRLTQAESE